MAVGFGAAAYRVSVGDLVSFPWYGDLPCNKLVIADVRELMSARESGVVEMAYRACGRYLLMAARYL